MQMLSSFKLQVAYTELNYCAKTNIYSTPYVFIQVIMSMIYQPNSVS